MPIKSLRPTGSTLRPKLLPVRRITVHSRTKQTDPIPIMTDIEKYSDRFKTTSAVALDGSPMAALEDTHIQRAYDRTLLPNAIFEGTFEKKKKTSTRAKASTRTAKKATDALGDEDDDGKASVAGSDENEDEEEEPELDEEAEEEEEDENDYGDNYFDGGEDDGGEGGDALGGGGDEGPSSFLCSVVLLLTLRYDRRGNVRLVEYAAVTHSVLQSNSFPQNIPVAKNRNRFVVFVLILSVHPFFRAQDDGDVSPLLLRVSPSALARQRVRIRGLAGRIRLLRPGDGTLGQG